MLGVEWGASPLEPDHVPELLWLPEEASSPISRTPCAIVLQYQELPTTVAALQDGCKVKDSKSWEIPGESLSGHHLVQTYYVITGNL